MADQVTAEPLYNMITVVFAHSNGFNFTEAQAAAKVYRASHMHIVAVKLGSSNSTIDLLTDVDATSPKDMILEPTTVSLFLFFPFLSTVQ